MLNSNKPRERIRAAARGQPAQVPDGLHKTIIEFSKTRKEIDSAYIAILERVEIREFNLIIGLRVIDNEKEVFGELSEAIRPYASKDKPIDLIKIDGDNGISGYFNTIEPIYKK